MVTNEDKERIKKFWELMEEEIKKHEGAYGDSWKTETTGYLQARLEHKIKEYGYTFNSKKLVSVANLAMLLHLRMTERRKND